VRGPYRWLEESVDGIEMKVVQDDIVLALSQVYDPEIPVNVYDLGLIYKINIDDNDNVVIDMTLTAPNCPIADDVVENVRESVADVPGVANVVVQLVFEPAWSIEMMSDAAKVELGLM